MSTQVSEAFDKMVQLGLLLGVRSIKDRAGAWVQKVDEQWVFAINGHDESVKVSDLGISATIKPFEAAVWFNGWLCASLSPFEGVFFGGKEDEFIEALDRAIEAKA